MITDPALIREAIGWTEARINVVKNADGWPERVDALLNLLQPLALLETYPWHLEENPQMAAEVWMAEQDRSGLTLSPAFAVPPGKAECKITINATGFANEAQGIGLELRVSMNGKQSFQGGGGGFFWGGAVPTGKNGQPGERAITCQLLPEMYPTHAQVAMEVAGVVNCGVSVEFLDPPAP